ncbi:MAG TPA: hypothetical protein VLJ68_06465, partial [Chitinophagaceae bacterium]|nr:hypothetical protein [Chitinophagaceae bacterium]
LTGINIKTLMSSPDIYHDTVLAKIEVDDAPYKVALFRIANNRAEKILAEGDPHPSFPDKKVIDIRDFNSSGADHLVIEANANKRISLTESSSWVSYSKGNWKTIIGGPDELQAPKGYSGYKVGQLLFLKPDQDRVLIPVSLIKTDYVTSTSGTSIYTYYVPYAVYFFDGEKLSTLIRDDMKIMLSSALPVSARQIPGIQGAFISLSLSKGDNYFDFTTDNPLPAEVPALKTNGTDKIMLSDVIGRTGDRRFIAVITQEITTQESKKRTTIEKNITGFFELSFQTLKQ